MQPHQLQPKGRSKKQIRGRGIGSRRGGKSGRGQKGQKARAGYSKRPGFAGGSNPLFRLTGKLRGAGKMTPSTRKPATITAAQLNVIFADGAIITPKVLRKNGLVSDLRYGVKILGTGEIKKKFYLQNLLVTSSVAKQVAAAGGKVSIVAKNATMTAVDKKDAKTK